MRRSSLAAASLVFLAAPLSAQTLPAPDTDCNLLPNPVFIEAGDTQMPLLGELARVLRDAEQPLTLIYLPRSTCTLAENFFSGIATTEVMRYVPNATDVPTWDGIPHQCNNQVGGFPMDLAIGATFISSCNQSIQDLQPTDVTIFEGPVMAYGFVVPEGVVDSVPGITREEAYFVFGGVGAAHDAVPWIDEPAPDGGTPTVYIRGPTNSTVLTLAANVEPTLLPAASWVGYELTGQNDRSSVVINGVSAAAGTPTEGSTIGILGVNLYDGNRGVLDLLAYQAKGQRYGYYPDKTRNSRDRQNVRDGHYLPWAYTQYIAKVTSAGGTTPVNADVARIIAIVTGQPEARIKSTGITPSFDVDALEPVAQAGLVPDCAMKVKRDLDGGDLSLYSPTEPCGCGFEAMADPTLLTDTAWMAKCTSCTTNAECGTGKCRHGYCEAK